MGRKRATDEAALKRINRHLRRKGRSVCARWINGRRGMKIERHYYLVDERRRKVVRTFVGMNELAVYFGNYLLPAELEAA